MFHYWSILGKCSKERLRAPLPPKKFELGSRSENQEDLIWDSVGESELIAIESSYYSSKRRRLPNWAKAQAKFSPSPCTQMRYPAMNFAGRIAYCRTVPEVESATMEIMDRMKTVDASRVPIGLDIEWRPIFRKGAVQRKAAVMQLCVDATNCYVMHIIHSGFPPALKSLLENSSFVKVGVGIASDATLISRDYDVSVEPLEDLSKYANLKLGGASKIWSLSSLTETLTCKELAKPGKVRLGNWEVDVLSREQLQYAATDAYVSWNLYQILKSFPDKKSDSEHREEVNDAVP